MLLVDATGHDASRLQRIDNAIKDLLDGEATSVMVNRTIANGITTYTEACLKGISERSKFAFNVTRISLGYGRCDTDTIIRMALSNPGVIVIDEAERLDEFEGLAEALRSLESPYIKFVYIALLDQAWGLNDALEGIPIS